MLGSLRRFLVARRASDLDQSVFDQWRKTLGHLNPNTQRGREMAVYKFCNHRRRTGAALLCAGSAVVRAISALSTTRALRAGADCRAPALRFSIATAQPFSTTSACCPTCDCIALHGGTTSGRSRSIADVRPRPVVWRFAHSRVEVSQAPLDSLVAQRSRGAASVRGTSAKHAQRNVPDGAAPL